jgi:DNA-3-methyladenine glycosylase
MTPEALTGRPEDVAAALVGARLRARWPGDAGPVLARLVEVEAYGGEGEDPGSHAHRGRRPRNEVMFGRPGMLYVYFTYGMHWCANVVCHEPGTAGAVLLRAARIESGTEIARARTPSPMSERDLARGPARLARALGITGEGNGLDVLATWSPIRLLPGVPPREIRVGPRVGVAGDGASTPWRFWDADAAEVSAYRPAAPRGAGRGPTRARPTGRREAGG